MKHFILIFFATTLSCQGQIVNIPDANFKNALVNGLSVNVDGSYMRVADADTNNDGEIQVSEADAVLGLFVDSKNIVSLIGLEYFINLERLEFDYNDVQNVNLNTLSRLKWLDCYSNQLTEIDLTSNQDLETG